MTSPPIASPSPSGARRSYGKTAITHRYQADPTTQDPATSTASAETTLVRSWRGFLPSDSGSLVQFPKIKTQDSPAAASAQRIRPELAGACATHRRHPARVARRNRIADTCAITILETRSPAELASCFLSLIRSERHRRFHRQPRRTTSLLKRFAEADCRAELREDCCRFARASMAAETCAHPEAAYTVDNPTSEPASSGAER